jgi:tetratricopeptide (TPR) repeat protein
MKRKLALTLLVGTGIGLTGCQGGPFGGLSIWNRNNSGLSSTAPDVGKQKFNGLSQSLAGDQPRPMGQAQSGSAALGGLKGAESDNFIVASWKKTTAAVSGAVAAKPKVVAPEDDPLRLDKFPKKIGADVYIGAARLLENSGKFEEAEEKYKEALRATPGDLSAQIGLARLYDRQGQAQKAVETYQKAIQGHPTSSLAYNDLGLCFRRKGQIDNAIGAFRKSVELTPDEPKYHNNLAAALIEVGRNDEALKELSATSSAAVAHYNLAFLLQQKGQRADAVRHLQQAIAIDPSVTPARELLNQLAGGTATAAPSVEPAFHAGAPVKQEEAAGPYVNPYASASSPYATGASDQQLYTSAPQIYGASPAVDSPAAAASSSYHIGDDGASAANVAQRTQWGSAASSASHPLPPVE